jgi:hypothetical protein
MPHFACPAKSVFFYYPGVKAKGNSAEYQNWTAAELSVRDRGMGFPLHRADAGTGQKESFCNGLSLLSIRSGIWLQTIYSFGHYTRVKMQLVAKVQKYEGNIPIKSTPQHANAKASTVVREGLGMVTSPSEVWKYITTTTLR